VGSEMAKLDALRKIEGLRKLIDQYKRGEEVNPRDLRPLLSDVQWEQMDLELQRRQQLKKQRRPERLAVYEEQHRQCATCNSYCAGTRDFRIRQRHRRPQREDI
jgi:hypothetical protein